MSISWWLVVAAAAQVAWKCELEGWAATVRAAQTKQLRATGHVTHVAVSRDSP